MLTVLIPPLLLVAASSHTRCEHIRKKAMAAMPVFEQLATWFGSSFETEIIVLVARLRLLHQVLGWHSVHVSTLLGSRIPSDRDCSLRVPSSHFHVQRAPRNLHAREFMTLAVGMRGTWAFAGSSRSGPDGWLFLRSDPHGDLVILALQSTACRRPEATQLTDKLQDADLVWLPSMEHVSLYIIDQYQPNQGRIRTQPRELPAVVPPPHFKDERERFCEGCIQLVRAGSATHRSRRVYYNAPGKHLPALIVRDRCTVADFGRCKGTLRPFVT